jgi:hypothetical protein
MSIALNENSLKFAPEDITDVSKLIARLIGHSDPVATFVWERLPKEDQSTLINYQESESNLPESRRIVIRALNKILEEPSIYGERFRGIALGPDTFSRTLNVTVGGRADPYLNRLLLRDAFPAELSRTIIHSVTTHKLNEPVAMTITLTNSGGGGPFHIFVGNVLYDGTFSYRIIAPSGNELKPHLDLEHMAGGSGSSPRLEPHGSLQYISGLSDIYKFDEIGSYAITVWARIDRDVNAEVQMFHVVSNPLKIEIVPDK